MSDGMLWSLRLIHAVILLGLVFLSLTYGHIDLVILAVLIPLIVASVAAAMLSNNRGGAAVLAQMISMLLFCLSFIPIAVIDWESGGTDYSNVAATALFTLIFSFGYSLPAFLTGWVASDIWLTFKERRERKAVHV